MPDVLCGGLRLCVQQGLDLALRRGLGEAASCRRQRPRLCYRILPSLHLGKHAGLVGLNLMLRDPSRFMHRVQLIRQAHRDVANLFGNPWHLAAHGGGGCSCGCLEVRLRWSSERNRKLKAEYPANEIFAKRVRRVLTVLHFCSDQLAYCAFRGFVSRDYPRQN